MKQVETSALKHDSTARWSSVQLPSIASILIGVSGLVQAGEESMPVPQRPRDPIPVVAPVPDELDLTRLDFNFQEKSSVEPPLNKQSTPAEAKTDTERSTDSNTQSKITESATTTTQARDFGIALTTIGLGVLSVLAAVRGVIKGSIEVSLWRKSIKRFDTREFTDMIALNAYSLIPDGEGYTLQADTKDRPLLAEFLGGNQGARNYFIKAAKQCTYTQPLVCLEFPRDYQEHSLGRQVKKFLTAPLYYLSGKKICVQYQQPPHPNEERFAALNRINKLLREAVSASYNGSSIGLVAKQFQKEIPISYFEKSVYVIPLCAVAPPGVKQSRVLSVATISAEDFERFGNIDEINKIKPANELYPWHIDLLKHAFKEHLAYQRYTNTQGKPQELFPKVRIMVFGNPQYYDTTARPTPGASSNNSCTS